MVQGYPTPCGGGSGRWPSLTHGRGKPAEAVPPSKETVVKHVRILLDLRTSNGLHLRQGNLSYGELKRLVGKLEGLC